MGDKCTGLVVSRCPLGVVRDAAADSRFEIEGEVNLWKSPKMEELLLMEELDQESVELASRSRAKESAETKTVNKHTANSCDTFMIIMIDFR